MTKKMVATALKYKEKYGFSVIPTDGKVSRVKWKSYQDQMPSDEIIADWFTRWPKSNMAVVTGTVSGYICVVDVDAYKDDTVMNSIKSLIPDGLSFPISTTPRGGQHWWFRSSQQLGDKIGFLKGVDFRSMGIIIIPPSKGYKWLITPKSTPIPALPDSIIEALGDDSFNFGDNKVKTEGFFENGTRDVEMFTVANSLIKTGQSKEFAEDVLSRIMLSWGEEDSKWAQDKVASAMKRHETRNLTEEIKEWTSVTSGTFSVTECDKDLNIVTTCDKANRRKILSRMVKDEIIERVGSKNGMFRKREVELDAMNWQEEDTSLSYDLKLPLGLHKMIDFNPGNIVFLAGEKEVGKTAFALTTALMNNDKDVRYFNSEMGSQELKKRLLGFPDVTESSWNHVKFYNRAYNHSDVIFPDSLNIIDFLEVSASEGFFSVVDIIRKIHDKIVTGKGLVIVCMQRRKGEEYARGGAFTAEKARAYFNLSFQELEIKHCKSPKFGLSVHGKKIGFTLQHGNTFIEDKE